MPVQRLPRYILLLKELTKHTWPKHGDYNNLNSALQAMESIVSKINRQKRLSDSNFKLNQISSTVKGSVEFTEKAQVYFGEGVLQTKDVDFASVEKFDINDKSMECVYVFLFSNFLMKAKKLSSAKPSNLFKRFKGFKFSVLQVLPLDDIEVKRLNSNDTAFVLIEKDHSKLCHIFCAESSVNCNNWLSNFMGALKCTESA